MKAPRRSPPKSRQLNIALSLPWGIAIVERLLPGIVAFANEHGGWSFTRLPELTAPTVEWLRHWNGDGAMAFVLTPRDLEVARSVRFPVVNLAGRRPGLMMPTVMVDHERIGELAAQHLLDRGFTRFGYYGSRSLLYSDWRCRGFVRGVAARQRRCEVLQAAPFLKTGVHWKSEQDTLREWLGRFRYPVGIFACHDQRARMVLDACAALKLRVPAQVAVLGVDNDLLVCESASTPLSSIAKNDYIVGYEAAKLLDRLITGGAKPARPVLIAPEGVVQRQSTDVFATDDPHVACAINYAREHVHEPFGVERLVNLSTIPRRNLEQRFQAAIGRTPYVFISEVRVEHAKLLLGGRERLSLTRIAELCGYSELRRFRVAFSRITGMTPAQYRIKEAGGRSRP